MQRYTAYGWRRRQQRRAPPHTTGVEATDTFFAAGFNTAVTIDERGPRRTKYIYIYLYRIYDQLQKYNTIIAVIVHDDQRFGNTVVRQDGPRRLLRTVGMRPDVHGEQYTAVYLYTYYYIIHGYLYLLEFWIPYTRIIYYTLDATYYRICRACYKSVTEFFFPIINREVLNADIIIILYTT